MISEVLAVIGDNKSERSADDGSMRGQVGFSPIRLLFGRCVGRGVDAFKSSVSSSYFGRKYQ